VALTSISVVASATSVSGTITWPGGLQAGDVAFICDWLRQSSGTPTEVVASGFTKIFSDGNTGTNSQHMLLEYKILTGSESGSLTVQDGTSADGKVMLIIRGNEAIARVTASTPTNSGVTASNPSPQDILASGGTPPLIALGCFGASSAISPRTWSPSPDGEVGSSNNQCWVGYKIYNSSPADHSIDMDDEGSQIMMGLYLQFEGPKVLAADAASFTLTGQDVGLHRSLFVAAGAASFALTGQDVDLVPNITDPVLDAEAASYAFTAQDVLFDRATRISAEAAAFALTANDVGLLAERMMVAAHATYTLTGENVGLLAARELLADAAAYTLTVQDVALSVSMPAEPAAYLLTGNEVSIRATRFLDAEAAAYVLTGNDADLRKGKRIIPEPAEFILSGQDVAFLRDLLFHVEPAVFVLTARRAALVYRDYGPEARIHARALLTHLVEGRVTPYWTGTAHARALPAVLTSKRVMQ